MTTKDCDENCSKHGTEHGTILLEAWLVLCMITVLEHYPCQQTTNHFRKIIVVEELQEVYDEDDNYYHIFSLGR
jgi:hypothetical protein